MMTDESTINIPESEPLAFAPLGEVFVSVRNAKKLEIKDISDNLRLSIKQIGALESNDFASLPQPVITRGFIRNYARLLEVDAEPLLASYRARMPEALPSALNVQTSMHQIMTIKATKSWLKYIIGSMLVLLLTLVWYLYMNYMPRNTKKSPENAIVASSNAVTTTTLPLPLPLPLPEVALPAAERMVDSSVEAGVEAGVSGEAKDAYSAAPLPAKEQSANTSVPQNSQLPKVATEDFNTLKANAARLALEPLSNQVIVADANKSVLKPTNSIAAVKSVAISVSEQTWVRVTDKTGAVVYEKMLGANSEDGFDGLPPFKMLIGNAKATKLTFLGQPVDLLPSTKNNVAHVTLE
jgi:cytoskeleton protein RodZ